MHKKRKKKSFSFTKFKSPLVLDGNGKALVTATGEHSQFGELVRLLSQEEPPRTPLQKSMDKLGQQLSFTSFGIIGIIFCIGWFQGKRFLTLKYRSLYIILKN